jgi:hypothetical protein
LTKDREELKDLPRDCQLERGAAIKERSASAYHEDTENEETHSKEGPVSCIKRQTGARSQGDDLPEELVLEGLKTGSSFEETENDEEGLESVV